MPKLLFVVTEDWYFVSHRLSHALAARAAGFEVSVATRLKAHAQRIEDAGIRTIPFAMSRQGLNPLIEMATVLKLARLLRREDPDILHLVALKPVLLGGLASMIAGMSHTVSAIAGLGFLFSGRDRFSTVATLLRRLLPRLLGRGLAILQNPEDAAMLQECGVAPERIRLVPGSGVDVKRFVATSEPAGPPVVMLPSRLLWDKGVGEFVAAACTLKNLGIAARFVLVGKPDPDNPTTVPEAAIRKWVEEGIVEWWGHQEDMPAVLARAHVVCLPSFYREGLPRAVLEAMACGRAVVTTDAPGCREAVRHGDNGLLVPVRNAPALAAAIGCLLEDGEMRKAMGARGRERVLNEFADEIILPQILGLYRELLG